MNPPICGLTARAIAKTKWRQVGQTGHGETDNFRSPPAKWQIPQVDPTPAGCSSNSEKETRMVASQRWGGGQMEQNEPCSGEQTGTHSGGTTPAWLRENEDSANGDSTRNVEGGYTGTSDVARKAGQKPAACLKKLRFQLRCVVWITAMQQAPRPAYTGTKSLDAWKTLAPPQQTTPGRR